MILKCHWANILLFKKSRLLTTAVSHDEILNLGQSWPLEATQGFFKNVEMFDKKKCGKCVDWLIFLENDYLIGVFW